MNKRIVMFCMLVFVLSGCATTETVEKYTYPGPHYLKAEDKPGKQAVGNIVGMFYGGAAGFIVGTIGSLIGYVAINGHTDFGMAPWLIYSSLICVVPGAVIGWNMSWDILAVKTDEEKKQERQKQIEEKYKDLYRDKNPQ